MCIHTHLASCWCVVQFHTGQLCSLLHATMLNSVSHLYTYYVDCICLYSYYNSTAIVNLRDNNWVCVCMSCVTVYVPVCVCLHVCALHACSSGSVDSMYDIWEQYYSQYSLMCIRGAWLSRCCASVSIDSPIVLFNYQLQAILASSKLITPPAGFVFLVLGLALPIFALEMFWDLWK